MADEEKPSARSGAGSSGGDVISNLPRHRPHRRSEKRAASGGRGGGANATEKPSGGRPSTATARPAAKAERSGGKAGAKAVGKAAASPTAASPTTASPTTGSARERIGRTASAKTRAPTPPDERRAGRAREARRPATPSAELPGGPSSGTELVGTVVQAAGELAQIGLTLGTQAVKNAVKRLPKP